MSSEKTADLVRTIFLYLGFNIGKVDYLSWISERGIIASNNDAVDWINQVCLDQMSGQEVTLHSRDANHIVYGDHRLAIQLRTLIY